MDYPNLVETDLSDVNDIKEYVPNLVENDLSDVSDIDDLVYGE